MSIRHLLLGFAAPCALAAGAAHAQSTDTTGDTINAQQAAADPQSAAADTSGDIVVTAQLRRQQAQQVPFALTAYTGKFLDDLGIAQFDRLSRFTPGFVVQNQSPNNPGFVMRGITSDSGAAFSEPRVSVFQDGVSISMPRGSYVELFDVDRVEIAKGPQATLYGRAGLIGAVNVIDAKADPSGYYGYFYGSYGNYNAYRIDDTLNVPLTDNLAVRVAGRVNKRDGYVDNLLGKDSSDNFNSIDTEAVRGSLRWQPGNLTLDLVGNYQTDSASGTSFKSIAYVPTDPTTGAVLGDRSRTSGAALAAPADFEGGHGLGIDRHVWSATGIANYAFDSHWSLNALGSYRHFDDYEVFDADGTSLPALTAADDVYGNQTMGTLRLTYDGPKVTAFVGGTLFHQDGAERTPTEFDERVLLARLTNTLNGGGAIPGRPADEPAPLAIFSNTAFTSALLQGVAALKGVALDARTAQGIAANLQPGHLESSTNYGRTNSFDLFGDVTLHVTTKFELGGGLRYTHDDKSTGYSAEVLNGRSILGGFIGALSQPAATRTALLTALAAPGAATIPLSAAYPVPLFGLGLQPTANNGDRTDQDFNDDGVTFRAFARYELSPEASLYANYGRGRRPKVLSVAAPGTPFGAAAFTLVPAESVDSWETGVKTALAHRTLFIDGSIYYYRYNHFQTTEQVNTQFVTTDAGKADSYGFEGQVRWNPVDALGFFATYAYNHGRFQSGAYKGNQFRLAPDHAASAGFVVRAPVGPGRIDFTPSVTYQSKTFFDDNNDRPDLQTQNLIPDLVQDEFQNGYALVDARLGFEPRHGWWRIEAFVTNLTNHKYIKDAGNTGDDLGMPTFIAGEPRFYGISLTMRTR